MARFGLIGKNIEYSFSRSYFREQFEAEGLPHTYENFDLETIETVNQLKELKELGGLNVTIPYKEAIIPFLDGLDPEAQKIGAVNTIKIQQDGSWIGYNTDHYGFARSLNEQGMVFHRALILGSGGASKAIRHVLEVLDIEYQLVSRNPQSAELSYQQLRDLDFSTIDLIINGTPLGTFPNTDACPDLPYDALHKDMLLYDLIYNPPTTRFMQEGLDRCCQAVNGQKMLEYQAQKAWLIWNS